MENTTQRIRVIYKNSGLCLHLGFILLVFVSFTNSTVVDITFSSCRLFFYKGVPPRGIWGRTINAICQRHMTNYHFATLYSSELRMPFYSAYTLEHFTCSQAQPNRRSRWYIEPQLSGANFPAEMNTEGTFEDTHKRVQAINKDYPNTNFDRGHLNPNFYQCDDSRTATFTLTNAVPQDPCFNQQMWKDMEEISKNVMQELCSFEGAKRYFVTGALPGSERIPSLIDDTEGDRHRDYDRVTVPSIMWTAGCCDSSDAVKPEDKDKGFSFSYYGENVPESYVIPYNVVDLEVRLALILGNDTFKIFVDDCLSLSENSKKARAKLAVPVERQIAKDLESMSRTRQWAVPSSQTDVLNSAINLLNGNVPISLKFWNVADAVLGLFLKRVDIQKTRDLFASTGMTPILTADHSKVAASRSDIADRLVSVNSTSGSVLENTLTRKPANSPKGNGTENVTERNSTLDTTGMINYIDKYVVVSSTERTLTATGSRCRQDNSCDYNGQNYKWCYIDWSNNWDYCCHKKCGFEQNTDYAWCNTNDAKDWAYCSERSSMISVKGRKCIPGHECGLHGAKIHWCYTDFNRNWEYCCQPWHECANHNESYKWCWVGRQNKTKWKNCEY
ncbi:uncharacterized protein LOC123535355 [Mercenaria mercenaria]|uniref:uncharacterized protein LOC123535355 n=1 Tax=Mercenaria mercenaria TaxID=6596 RepID=UPI001E1E14E3|nr:uncharacterized protein LOC123535355 [Mercenaria mercenaria]XP_045173915.1 uncharacterized protein LOC123535355 [Mercenaria mercenaria]